jgi:hypothetical protein
MGSVISGSKTIQFCERCGFSLNVTVFYAFLLVFLAALLGLTGVFLGKKCCLIIFIIKFISRVHPT